MAAKRYLQIRRDGGESSALLQVPLKDGEQGNFQTLRAMIEIVRSDRLKADLRRLVLTLIVGDVAGHDSKGELAKVFEFAQKRIVYRRDPVGVERVNDLWTTIFGLENSADHRAEGDCGIKSVFFATAAALLGYRPYFVIVRQIPENPAFNHIYNAVEVDGEFYYFDATPEDKPAGYRPAGETFVVPIFD